METLVTGATGFVGRALVAALRARGDAVRALVRPGGSAAARQRLEALGADLVPGDVEDEAAVTRAAAGAEVVFHCAALVSFEAPRARLEAVNLVGTENVLGACRTAGVARLVHVSTESVTRGLAPRSYVTEDHPQPAVFLDAYSETKALAEDLVVAAHGAAFETVAVRPGWIWGPDDTTVLPQVLGEVRAGRFAWVDGGRSLCATTYIANLVDALLLAASAPSVGKAYYVTDDERVPYRDFVGQLIAAAGLPVPVRSVPFGVAYAAAWLSERTFRRAHLNRSTVVLGGRSFHFNIQRARKDLGYAPRVTLAAGMPRLRAWVAARGGAEAVARAEVTVEPPAT